MEQDNRCPAEPAVTYRPTYVRVCTVQTKFDFEHMHLYGARSCLLN